MSRVPDATGVVKAIRGVRAATRRSLKGINQLAGKRMSKGDYAAAEHLVTTGKEIRQFDSEVVALLRRWRELCGGGVRLAGRKAKTPLWQYYQPVLRAIAAAGGECRRPSIESRVQESMREAFQPGDAALNTRGRERWRAMVQRSRRDLVQNGWVAAETGRLWRITDAGKAVAELPPSEFQRQYGFGSDAPDES